MQPQAIADARALADLRVAERNDVKVQPGRRERAEIVGILEEPKRRREIAPQQLAPLENVARAIAPRGSRFRRQGRE